MVIERYIDNIFFCWSWLWCLATVVYPKYSDTFGPYYIYRFRPNYRTVRLGISKILKENVVKYVTTYTKASFYMFSLRNTDHFTVFSRT